MNTVFSLRLFFRYLKKKNKKPVKYTFLGKEYLNIKVGDKLHVAYLSYVNFVIKNIICSFYVQTILMEEYIFHNLLLPRMECTISLSKHLLRLVWHKVRSIWHPVRIKLTSYALLAKLTNHYIMQRGNSFKCTWSIDFNVMSTCPELFYA